MSKRVLIVDDDRDMVATLADILEMHGWTTLKGYNGADAIRIATENDIDAVLMDVRMPSVDGITALHDIKAKKPSTRVILMTAFIGQDLMARAEQEGALKVLKKPLDLGELLGVLDEDSSQGRPVLVVDDDPDHLHALAGVLAENGFHAIEAATLEAALALMQSEEPTAILLDLKLDHFDPHSNMVAIRQIDPTVMLILVSGHPQDLSKAIRSEAPGMIDAAFTKPIPIERLLAVLGSATAA